jgi:hypothetical protein
VKAKRLVMISKYGNDFNKKYKRNYNNAVKTKRSIQKDRAYELTFDYYCREMIDFWDAL